MKRLAALLLTLMSVFLFACGEGTDAPAAPEAAAGEAWGDIEDAPAEPTMYSLEDKIQTDSVELTLHSCTFQDYVKSGGGSKMYAGDDRILACLDLTLKNNSDSEIWASSVMDVEIVYDDDFSYNTRDLPTYLFDEDRDYYLFFYGGSGKGTGVEVRMSPHSSADYLLGIQCHKALGKDTESPLTVTFTLPNNGRTEKFTYLLR